MTASPKVVLVTGANTGIGYQIVKTLAGSEKPYTILVGSRSTGKAQDAIASIQQEIPSTISKLFPIVVDIESDDSIKAAYEEVSSKYGKLDFLVNNAGAQFDQEYMKGQISEREMWNKSWNVNVSSTQVITSTFVPLLIKSSDPRLLFVTSGTSTLAGTENKALAVNKNPDAGWPKQGFAVPAYRSAKTGLNMLYREWYRILLNDGVKVFAISPGWLATGLGGNLEMSKKMGAQDPSVAGPFIVSVLEGKRDEDAGKVLLKDTIQPW